MSILSELLPSGSGSDIATFVASGLLSSGSPVVLKSNGEIESVTGQHIIIAQNIPVVTPQVYAANVAKYSDFKGKIAYDPNTENKFVVLYMDGDNNNYPSVAVGTIAGTTLTFGTPVVINSSPSQEAHISFDPNTAGRFVIGFNDSGLSANSNYRGFAIVGTVSGTTITLGTKVQHQVAGSRVQNVAFDPNTANTFVIAYNQEAYTGSTVTGGFSVAATIAGTVITFGSRVAFEPPFSANESIQFSLSVSFDPTETGRFVVLYKVSQGSPATTNTARAVIGTVSGTTITFGTVYVHHSGLFEFTTGSFDTAGGRFVSIVTPSAFGTQPTAILGTVSGTTITFGTAVNYAGRAEGINNPIAFDPTEAGKFAVLFMLAGGQDPLVVIGKVTGTSFTFNTPAPINNSQVNNTMRDFSLDFNPFLRGRFIALGREENNNQRNVAIICQRDVDIKVTNLTTSNFVGLTAEEIVSGASGSVTLQAGVSLNQTSLTIGETYYVQYDGAVTTVADAQAVNIGKALSATTLKLKGLAL